MTTESRLVSLVSRAAPWLAPVPTAYLVGRACMSYLAYPWPVAAAAALVIECLGLSATATALELYEYTKSKRKTDPAAPLWLAIVLVGVYAVVAVGLTVALDIVPQLRPYAPGIFPGLSLVGVTVLAIRSDHARRLAEIANSKAEAAEERKRRKAEAQAENPLSQPAIYEAQDNGYHEPAKCKNCGATWGSFDTRNAAGRRARASAIASHARYECKAKKEKVSE